MAATPSPKIKQKLIILLIIMALIFLALVLRLFQVEILKGDEYAARAARQQTRNTALNAQRGRIMDRNGIVLAQSGTSYRVLVNPQVIAESERVRISIEVSDVLGLDYDYVYERVCRVEKQQIVLKRQVESGVVDQLTALQLGRGISFSADMKRYYPMGNLFSQLIGFTGTDGEGQTGIEASYDEYLAGKNGRLVTEVDRNNHALSYGEEEYIAPIDGYDMTLTTDSVAESYVETAVAECYSVNKAKQVTALLMNPKTGEILSSTTYPTFDLNAPPRSDVASLLEMSRNRSVSETYEPGSIFKIITLAAALDSGAVTMEDTFSCKGYEQYGFEKIRCWKTKGHGTQTLAEAVQNSCNCAFMQMAQKMGVNTLYDYIYAFGFGASTECGIPGEDEGSIIHRKYIRDADLARVSFGQSITVTPVQMLNAACAAINSGVLMQPYVVSSITATDGTDIKGNEPTELRRVISEDASAKVRQLLQGVVEKGSGTAAQVQNYTVGGKTGTAQKYDENGKVSSTLLIASFIGFLPANNPQLACLIMVDEPQVPVVYGSTVAAPWVGDILSDLVQYYSIMPDNSGVDYKEVPNVVGMTMTDAIACLNDSGFIVSNSLESEAGAVVVTQIPAAGSNAARHSEVLLYNTMTTFNSEGEYVEYVEVPDLSKKRRQEAYDLLAELGLRLNYDKTFCTGLIIGQSIEAGSYVLPGTEIFVTFNGYYAQSGATEPPGYRGDEPTPDPNAPGQDQPADPNVTPTPPVIE